MNPLIGNWSAYDTGAASSGDSTSVFTVSSNGAITGTFKQTVVLFEGNYYKWGLSKSPVDTGPGWFHEGMWKDLPFAGASIVHVQAPLTGTMLIEDPSRAVNMTWNSTTYGRSGSFVSTGVSFGEPKGTFVDFLGQTREWQSDKL